jgi:glycosyltransferase involved in cell wall biosynthesis
MTSSPSTAIAIVPAFNEEASIGTLVTEIRERYPDLDVLVIDDGSADRTTDVARASGAIVLSLPCNLGVGGAVQAGFMYASDRQYDYAVRCDGDGQHPPEVLGDLLAEIRKNEVDLVIGSRHLSDQKYKNTLMRRCGILGLSWLLTRICRKSVTDPTSGLQAFNRPLLYFFARRYPTDYPEPEALALMRRQGYDFSEVPATFRARETGVSSIGDWDTIYYIIKVFLALVVDRARRIDPRYSKENIVEHLS